MTELDKICSKCGAYEYCDSVGNCDLRTDFLAIKSKLEKVKTLCEEAVKSWNSEEYYEDDCDIFLGEKQMAEQVLDILEDLNL